MGFVKVTCDQCGDSVELTYVNPPRPPWFSRVFRRRQNAIDWQVTYKILEGRAILERECKCRKSIFSRMGDE